MSLPPVCPTLGASILGPKLAAVDSGQAFTLPVAIRDDFQSLVSSGPGSDWLVSLQQQQQQGAAAAGSSKGQSRTGVVELTGDARGRLKSGALLLDNLMLTSPPDSRLLFKLAAAPTLGSYQGKVCVFVCFAYEDCLPGFAGRASSLPCHAMLCLDSFVRCFCGFLPVSGAQSCLSDAQ